MKGKIIFFTLFIIITLSAYSHAAVTSVTLTPATPNTLSNGKAYYLAGVTYTFRVQATDPTAVSKADWSQIRLNFRDVPAATVRQSCDISLVTDSATVQTGVVVENVTDNTAGPYTNIDYTITVTFRWDCADFNSAPNNQIEAVVSGAGSLTDTKTINYGVCASIQVLNFTQDGVASDGRVNPWHQAFVVSGRIVYFVTDESITDRVYGIDSTEMTTALGSNLLLDGAPTAFYDNSYGAADYCSYNIPAEYMGLTLGNRIWRISVPMSTPGGPEVSQNSLTINTDRIDVDSITFYNGGGINSPYYRSTNIPGTRIQIEATLQNGGGSIVGNTYFVVTDGDNNYTVQINDGQTTGNVLIDPLPNITQVPNGTTSPITYQVVRIYGGAYDGNVNGSVGQYSPAQIVQPAIQTIYWDNNDWPGSGDPFTSWGGKSSTVGTMTLGWGELNTTGPDYDGDFDSYLIYYRKKGDTPWLIIDKDVNASLGDISTNSYTITGLFPLTEYEYYIKASDIFGNIVPDANAVCEGAPGSDYNSTNTSASSISVTISDGVTQYPNSAFDSNGTAATRPLRQTAIRVSLEIITAGESPSAINLILADDSNATDLENNGTLTGTEGVDYYRISCSKTGPNTYRAFIPETHALIAIGSNIRFIVELVKGGGTTYSDHDSEDEDPPGNPNDKEWTFAISTPTNFRPWPVRILNNVITRKNPAAYPSYYLNADAYVTIRVFDIKGRPVATIIEKALRKGGQNVREQGWRGINKYRRKLGVGLYYIHIKAKRASDNRVILNKFKKVVVAY
ncbi:fibronectin type III domain-containing protein [Spirochaetota bacterium]